MISLSFFTQKLTYYANCTGHLVKKGMAQAICDRLNKKHNYPEWLIANAVENMIDCGAKMSYHDIIQNITSERKKDEHIEEITEKQKQDMERTKNQCFNAFDCGSCKDQTGIEACHMLGETCLGVVKALFSKEIDKKQANEIMSRFKGLDWGLKKHG